MASPREKAQDFLKKEKPFRLGELLTESAHPMTLKLGDVASRDPSEAVRMLQLVDRDIPPVAERVFESVIFRELVGSFSRAILNGKKIFFTGCGATGRLSILFESAWRRSWRELKRSSMFQVLHPSIPDLEDHVISVMAGGDFALIKAVEGFEDYPQFGRYQLKCAGVEKDDVVVAITEGGETPFVIGTTWQGLDSGAEVFFVYNNPSDLLAEHVERSRKIIKNKRIKKIDLATGPMAITGSTRMQATTIELLVVGSALEIALARFLKNFLLKKNSPVDNLPGGELNERVWLDNHELVDDLPAAGICERSAREYARLFTSLLEQLESNECVKNISDLTELERDIYKSRGLVTYFTDSFLLDILTDTTERSPTFMIPPFRRIGDNTSPRSWAFVKDLSRPTVAAWCAMLEREPRGLEWNRDVYNKLDAVRELRENPPVLDNKEIYKFQLGNEPDPSRTSASDSAALLISIGSALPGFKDVDLTGFKRHGVVVIGPGDFNGVPAAPGKQDLNVFSFGCDLPVSPLYLWHHLAFKLVFNTISTATMACMGRVIGNAMVWLSPSNKKLIDRGSRLISQVTGCSYHRACIALYEAMDEVQKLSGRNLEAPSPVALAIKQLCLQ